MRLLASRTDLFQLAGPRLPKTSANTEIVCTVLQFMTKPAGSGSHGWKVDKTANCLYCLRDKDETKQTPGNLGCIDRYSHMILTYIRKGRVPRIPSTLF